MKKSLLLFILFIANTIFAQKDSLQLGDRYLEDQVYLGITYNQLYNQPEQVKGSGFSYGLNVGYLKDIPFSKNGRTAIAIGVGYAYDSFNHGLKVSKLNNEVIFETDPNATSNSLKIHALEFPFEFRWRTSSATTYKFWRVYAGIKLSYNLNNTFSYSTSDENFKYSNVDRYNKVQYGITLSAGFAAFNFNFYYGLTPLLKTATVGTSEINTKVIKIGLIFYIL